MTTNDQLLTVPEVATRLGISTEGVRRRIASGQIRAIKLGLHNSALRVASSDLHKYLDEHVVTNS
jgi:excisionase family DNA binding protein